MAIRKSKEEDFEMYGGVQDVAYKCVEALNSGGFSNVSVNTTIGQINADYHKATTWGYIQITVTSVSPTKSRVHVISTANADNIYALFRSPNKVIMDAFKSHLD